MSTLATIPLNTLTGEPATLADYAGKVLLLVNVASQCGFTPQYAELEKLYKAKASEGLVVLGFPANDFGAQEPGSNEEIGAFCEKNFGVTFPLFDKITVVGEAKHPLYKELIAEQPEAISNGNGLRDGLAGFASSKGLPEPNSRPEVLWNFEKFLVGRDGKVVARFESDILFDDPRFAEALEKALKA